VSRCRYCFVPSLIGIARAKGISAYIGDGTNRWPSVHRLDAARLFRLALEKAPAGTRLHAADDEGVQLREIAGVIGRRLKLPVVSISEEAAAEHFGWLSWIASMDIPTSSKITKQQFGWEPMQAGLIEDLDRDQYFML
jgi:nucleoside-diphosphate-sugar epimerase